MRKVSRPLCRNGVICGKRVKNKYAYCKSCREMMAHLTRVLADDDRRPLESDGVLERRERESTAKREAIMRARGRVYRE